MPEKLSGFVTLLGFGLMLGIGLILPLTTAQAQDTIKVPPINPLQGDSNETIYLPGASNAPADQGTYIQSTFLPQVTSVVVGLTGGMSLLFVIISGVQILTAYDNEERLTNAKKTLTWALLGFVISILSYGIVQIIVSINLSK